MWDCFVTPRFHLPKLSVLLLLNGKILMKIRILRIIFRKDHVRRAIGGHIALLVNLTNNLNTDLIPGIPVGSVSRNELTERPRPVGGKETFLRTGKRKGRQNHLVGI